MESTSPIACELNLTVDPFLKAVTETCTALEVFIDWAEQVADQEKYEAACDLVDQISANLAVNWGKCHYRTRSGRLLRTLDEVVTAILADELAV